MGRRTLFLVALVLALLLGAVGCRRSDAPEARVFSAPSGETSAFYEEVFGRAYSAEASVAAAAKQSCGDLAHGLRVVAGCYNRNNLEDVPLSGGSCAATWDCSCCYLHGIPAGASEELLASLMTRSPGEVEGVRVPEVSAPVPASVVESFSVPSEVRAPREPLIRPLREWDLLVWDVSTALTVMGIALVLSVGPIFALESHTLQGGWGFIVPIVGAAYIVLFGALMAHMWFPLTGITTALPANKDVLTGIRVFLVGLLAVGGYLVRTSQGKTKEDALGYAILLLVGVGLWWAYSLGSILPIVVVP
jgi:hypothetical protein